MNVFQLDFESRLRAWHNLRKDIETTNLETQCISTDNFWQQCPLVNHYLHETDMADWPDPWELLHDNYYCTYARGLGMIYTLTLLGIADIDFVEAKDYNNTDVILVFVNRAKYILNYWPNTMLNNNLQDFKIIHKINIKPIIDKAGLK